MCVVEKKTYIHPDGRREVIEKQNRCHNAVGHNLCKHVDYRNVDVARIVEARPSSSSSSSRPVSSGEGILVNRDGRERVYRTLTRRTSTRTPARRGSRAAEQSPVDSVSGSPFQPVTREIRPPAPTPPPVSSARRSDPFSPISPPDPNRTIIDDGTAIYGRPPSLEMPRAEENERPYNSRRSSGLYNAPESTESGIPFRRRSLRRRAGSRGATTSDEPAASNDSSVGSSLPGLSSLPQLRHRRNNSSTSNPQSTNSLRLDEALARRLQAEEDEEAARQAEIERNRLADSARPRRQSEDAAAATIRRLRLDETERRERNRISRQAEDAARQRAASNERAARREAEEAAAAAEEREREHQRRATQAALERQRTREDDELDRRIDAELAQQRRERERAADADRRLSQQQQQQQQRRLTEEPYQIVNRNTPRSRRRTTTLTTRPTFSPPSASPSPSSSSRTFPLSARYPNRVAVHNPPPSARNSLSRRGEDVIARHQARGAAAEEEEGRGMSAAMEELEADVEARMRDEMRDVAALDEEDDDAAWAGGARRSSRRAAAARERERRLREQGYLP